MKKFFKISKKKPVLGPFRALSANLGKNGFSMKKELCQFLNIPIIYHRAKNQKKIMSHSDRRRNRRTDRQRSFYRNLRIRRGPIIKVTLIFLEFTSTHQKPVYTINTSLFWEGKNIQNVGYLFKATWLLSELPNFLPKLRPDALAARLLIYKKCV